jgi:hypothetical protein
MQYNCGPNGTGETNRMARELGMPYTREEEDWLAVQVSKIILLHTITNLHNYYNP